jgi:hypothetical protein
MREQRTNEAPDTYSSETPMGVWIPASEFRSEARERRGYGRTNPDERKAKIIPLARREWHTPQSDPDETEAQPVGLIERLRQRKMVQWLIAYLAMAAIVLQLTEALADMWSIPVPVQRGISLTLGFGTLPALVLAWYHGEMGRQRVTGTEVGILGLLMIGTALAVWQVCWI